MTQGGQPILRSDLRPALRSVDESRGETYDTDIMNRSRSRDIIDPLVPGKVKRQEDCEGEALVLSYVVEGSDGESIPEARNRIAYDGLTWYVTYLDFEEDESSLRGVQGTVQYQIDHPDAVMAAEEFGELKVQLMDSMDSIEPSEDLAGKRAWYEAKMKGLRKQAERDHLDQLKAEVREFLTGDVQYPPEESLLSEILLSAGFLQRPDARNAEP